MATAKAYGARKIVAFDIEQSRVDFAVKHYADAGELCPRDLGNDIEASARNFILDKLKEHGLEGGVDVAIEVTGAESAALMSIFALRAQGTCE
jgi:threonine dehydrogenase-like Zn-dependent dehydrogenase